VRELRISVAMLALGAALVAAPAARAAITVGSTLTAPFDNSIGGDITAFPIAPAAQVTSSPVTGTIVGGHVKQAMGQAWGTVSLRVIHSAGGGLYQVIAKGANNAIPAGSGTFPVAAQVPITAGDIVAIQATGTLAEAVTAGATYDWRTTATFPVGGPPVAVNPGFTNTELLYNAQIDPSNSFTVGAPTGGKKGIATVVVTVPNPGTVQAGSLNDLALPAAAGTAKKKKKKKPKLLLTQVTASAASAGQVTLSLTASKAGRKVLRQKGKLKTTAKIVYTPTSGSPSSQTLLLKLKR
jgi:hypothetical protein